MRGNIVSLYFIPYPPSGAPYICRLLPGVPNLTTLDGLLHINCDLANSACLSRVRCSTNKYNVPKNSLISVAS